MPTTWMRDPEPDEVTELCERLKEARKHANLKAITGATFRPPDTPRFPNPTGILEVAQGLNMADIGFAAPKKVEYVEKPIRVAVTKNEEKTKVTDQPVSDYVEIPRENYFPVSSSMLRSSLEKRTDKSQQDDWNKLCNHLSMIVTAAYKSKVESLRETLSTADADPNYEIDAQTEMDMYSGLSDLALKAGFTPLTQTWFDTASAVDFSFRVPIEVNWEAMGSPVLEQYLRYGLIYKQEECPLFAPHTLIFIRGIDVDRKKDLFIPEKIDYILKSPKVNGIGGTLKMIIPRRSKKEVATRTSKGNTVVKRETLKSQFTQRGIIVGAASKVELKEPKFSDLIIIYRLENRLAGLPSAGSRYNFVVQRYHDVPMADIEALFPIRDIKFKTLDYLLMTINFVGLVALLLVSVWSIKGVISQMEAGDGTEKQEGTSASVIMLLVGMVIELVKKLIEISKEWRLMIGTYKNEISNWLDTRRSATGQVVVSALRDQVVEQELKEILLTYWLLWTKGPMKGKKLDEECEALLKDEFGVLADFNYEAGLAKLVTLRLATEVENVYSVTGTPAQINLRFQNISFLYDVRL